MPSSFDSKRSPTSGSRGTSTEPPLACRTIRIEPRSWATSSGRSATSSRPCSAPTTASSPRPTSTACSRRSARSTPDATRQPTRPPRRDRAAAASSGSARDSRSPACAPASPPTPRSMSTGSGPLFVLGTLVTAGILGLVYIAHGVHPAGRRDTRGRLDRPAAIAILGSAGVARASIERRSPARHGESPRVRGGPIQLRGCCPAALRRPSRTPRAEPSIPADSRRPSPLPRRHAPPSRYGADRHACHHRALR